MKKVFLGLILLFSFILFSSVTNAQAVTTSTSTSTKVAKAKKVKKAAATTAKVSAKQAKTKAVKAKAATSAKAATVDAAAKTKVKTTKTKAASATAKASGVPLKGVGRKTATTKAVANPVNKSADKVFGKDAKGRTIYVGPKGGHYYLNANGNKEYVK